LLANLQMERESNSFFGVERFEDHFFAQRYR
jgi:hypothetical protein